MPSVSTAIATPETHRWAVPDWLEPEAMIAILRAMPADGRSGDVYAVRTDQLTRLIEAKRLAKRIEGPRAIELRSRHSG